MKNNPPDLIKLHRKLVRERQGISPATVLGAIRQAPAINNDPTMRNLRNTGETS
ncbi:hypothetical protein OH809_19560 [Streptomyces sp. NBC_00873]|uniref:hypothetical protein n=1 Tax=unclassified Streptomyces TaxID=2593676 RepID=UPI00386A9B17|nr:hypothetical protein OH809_19560 [Streptomyces sp. NBC_00873]WTA45320.1 hypothetical protein OH821_24135 [Streptomyces sp. NBC_00842]